MIDIVLLGMQVSRAPLAVTAVGGNYALDDDRDTPDTMVATFQYPNFVLTWENRFANGRGLDGGGGHGSEFVGSKGTLIVDREKFQFFPEGDNKDQPEKKSPGFSHVMNLLECMKTRQQPRSNIESMHLTTKVCHLANIAYRTRKRIEWDDENERITNDSSAMRCESFKRKYRKPWRLPKVTV
jgi:predicted dehydrogenase